MTISMILNIYLSFVVDAFRIFGMDVVHLITRYTCYLWSVETVSNLCGIHEGYYIDYLLQSSQGNVAISNHLEHT